MRRGIATRVLGILICVAVSAVSAAPTEAFPREFFGIAKGALPLDREDVSKMQSTGVRTARFALNWSGVQPSPSSLNWGPTDKLVGNLAARGIRSAPFIYGSPPWVAEQPNRPPLATPTKVRAWRKFLALLVTRYGRAGTYWNGAYHQAHPGAEPKPILAWQIWNEPTLPKYFSGRNPARRYAKLVRISHGAITAVDSRARVVLAGLTGYAKPTAWAFLNKLYRVKGIKHDFDATALHPYAVTIRQFRTAARRFRRVMKRHHDARTALWLTEVGWGSAHPTRRFPLNKGLRGQKRMIQRSFQLVRQKRRSWHVARLFWFDWRDPARDAEAGCSFCLSAGLLRHSHKPKPAYRAFRRFAQAG
jgi:hypothetical protein